MQQMLLAAALMLCLALPAQAQEPGNPAAAYDDQELEQVQKWEAQWVGKKIDTTTIDQVSQYLPAPLVELYKDTAHLQPAAAGGLSFTIAPYRRVVETRGMRAATRTNARGVKLAAGGLLEHYGELSGMPFPNPKTGLEIAWNYDFNTRGDASQYRRLTPMIDMQLQAERPQDADCWELFFAHRVDSEPKPKLADNPRGIHWAGFYHMRKPNEYANTRRFNLRYLDPEKPDDQWMYNSATRRLSRLSAAQRTDTVEGSIVIYDDEFCWNGQISSNTYTLTGTRELLCPRHTDLRELKRGSGQSLFSDLPRERIKTYVVEVVSKEKDYVYGKRVWYVDPETYIILASEIYDRKGQIWKYIEQFTQDITTSSGETKNYIVGCHVIDLQRLWAAVSTQAVRGVGLEVSPTLFTPSSLLRNY